MNLNNAQLINYKDRIKFSVEDKKEYQEQIDYLVSSLEKKISENTETKVLKVLQSGSWRKGTIIKPKDDNPIDIDLIFFLDIDLDEYPILHDVNDLILPMLRSIYPNKKNDDFWDNPKTAGLEFVVSGLNVDVVPVGKTQDPEYVAQPDKDSYIYFTSPTKQLRFISERKTDNINYTTIVRILKKWRNYQDVKLSSFAIELIVAYLDINIGVLSDIQASLIRFFKWVSKKQFPNILFNAPYGAYKEDGSYVYIADPTNTENNVVRYLSNSDWDIVRVKANVALETILLADEEDGAITTIELWKEIFGTDFNINQLDN